jgi:acetoin utilization deacetylase AcuC-like enzyme
MQGTLMATDFALQYGCSMNIAGGTHHAFTNKGEGFCLLNDQAIAARYLLNEGSASKILIVDLDVHQGNGTAEIFKNEERVFTFSIHGANNYPLNKEKSDWDIPLPDGTEDSAYLNVLENALKQIIQRFEPDFMFFQSGVDVLKTDKIGRLGLSMTGCKERDKIVFENAHLNKIPVVASMGGGYSVKISDVVEAHTQTFRLAQEIFF